MGTKQIIKNSKTKNSFPVGKIQLGSGKERAFSIKSVLEDILIYHLRLMEIFFFKYQKITSVNFVGPDPRLLEIGAK